jgi:hypothetical protein
MAYGSILLWLAAFMMYILGIYAKRFGKIPLASNLMKNFEKSISLTEKNY